MAGTEERQFELSDEIVFSSDNGEFEVLSSPGLPPIVIWPPSTAENPDWVWVSEKFRHLGEYMRVEAAFDEARELLRPWLDSPVNEILQMREGAEAMAIAAALEKLTSRLILAEDARRNPKVEGDRLA